MRSRWAPWAIAAIAGVTPVTALTGCGGGDSPPRKTAVLGATEAAPGTTTAPPPALGLVPSLDTLLDRIRAEPDEPTPTGTTRGPG